jgi:phosphatidylserine/phosphatidylglycerophosphate/cardiolipin synthase-like enzyme
VISRIIVLALAAHFSLATGAEKDQPIEVYFSPGVSCTEAIVRELSNAKQTVHVQAYSFTSQPIARALTDAQKRGVKVIAILDASNRTKNYSTADFLAHEGVETYVDSMHAIAHNKIMIIDGTTVLTGSFNFTRAADQKNAENLLVIREDGVAAKYEQNWLTHFHHSEYYAGR